MKKQIKSGQSGASLVEYALLVALIAVVAIGAVTFLGQNVSTKLSSVASAIQGKGADDPTGPTP
ncbi:MAG: Flp family type IVb pilin [Bdellovibrionota bacterium]